MKYILLFTILLSCTKKVEIKQKKGLHVAKGIEVSLSDIKDNVWSVGKEKEATVSRGITFKIQVPHIESDGIQLLNQEYGIDTWVYKITKITRGSRRHVGYFQYNTRGISRVNDNVNVNLFYHAAAVSTDFRRFRCPAFNHRLRVGDYDVLESNTNYRNEIYIRKGDMLNGDVKEVGFAPMIFSVGQSIKGNYQFEIALYNSGERRLYSSWFSVPQSINVKSETQIPVKSCQGVKEEENPLPSSKRFRMEDLQIPK